MQKISLILNTIIHLKFIQIRYQFYYRIKSFVRKLLRIKYKLHVDKQIVDIKLKSFLPKTTSYKNSGFTFLNKTIDANKENKLIFNWENNNHGKLWDYNLNYMDYLLQPNMTKEEGLKLINYFIKNLKNNETGLEPYPIALRGINWIKFIIKFKVRDKNIENSLYSQFRILSKNLEYHLLANHLLEDALALLFGAFAFNNKKFYKKARKILNAELKQQILKDGGHFERSPMYHKILLDRMLDCINLLQSNTLFAGQGTLLNTMETKTSKMIQWLANMSFDNGTNPHFNDSTNGIAPTYEKLQSYAQLLDINKDTHPLSDSGYRTFKNNDYECVVNVGNITPAYQPGHAHADALNFVLNANKKPLIIDTGISTYEKNNTRLTERGTEAHNTVSINNQNSSGVWSGFRVAWRAKTTIKKDLPQQITAYHNGYRKLKTIHERTWTFNTQSIEITDLIEGKQENGKCFLHFAPGIKPVIKNKTVYCQIANIKFSENANIELQETQIPIEYNKFADSYKLIVEFSKQLKTTFKIIN